MTLRGYLFSWKVCSFAKRIRKLNKYPLNLQAFLCSYQRGITCTFASYMGFEPNLFYNYVSLCLFKNKRKKERKKNCIRLIKKSITPLFSLACFIKSSSFFYRFGKARVVKHCLLRVLSLYFMCFAVSNQQHGLIYKM